MIELHGLTKRFGAVTAVDDLSCTVRPGHVTGFLGPNGAGKTTTMRIILGLDRPDLGHCAGRGPSLPADPPPAATGRLAARRDGPARRAHRLRPPAVGGGQQRHRPRPGDPDAGTGRPRRGRSAARRRLLARHEAAPRYRGRAARRAAGADVRRAGQRTRHRRRPLDPAAAARARGRRPHGPGVEPPDERDGADGRSPDHHRPRQAAGRPADRPAHQVQHARRRAGQVPARRTSLRRCSPPAARPSLRRTAAGWP